MRFDDAKYVDAYMRTGKFPAIHSPVARFIRAHASEFEACMDLGACTGLLSLQALYLGRSRVIAVEKEEKKLRLAPAHHNLLRIPVGVNMATLSVIEHAIMQYQVTLVIARRVFPEIDLETPSIVRQYLAPLFHRAGVRKIILQGRNPVKNPKARLWKMELERDQLLPFYVPYATEGQVAICVRKA